MKIAGLEFGLGSFGSMTTPPIAFICIRGNEKQIDIPLAIFGLIFCVVCVGTFGILGAMQ